LKWHLRTELKKIHRQFQHTMIYVTHDQTEALTFADKVIVMYEGSVVQIGTPPELFQKPQHTFVGRFIGTPGMNIIKVNLRGNSAMLNDQVITLASSYGLTDGPAELGIRPEYIELSADRGLRAAVVAVEDLGRHLLVRTRVDDQIINVIARNGDSIPEVTRLNFESDKLILFRDSRLVEPRTV